MYSEGCYVVRVKGESMVDMQILEGDLLVVEGRNNFARNGEVVVAYLEGEGLTVKVYREEKDGTVVLEPRNSEYPSIKAKRSEVWIEGVVIGLLRRLKPYRSP
jgi:repressor LexA